LLTQIHKFPLTFYAILHSQYFYYTYFCIKNNIKKKLGQNENTAYPYLNMNNKLFFLTLINYEFEIKNIKKTELLFDIRENSSVLT
ncbi:hypothetical protein, partial [Niallia taxi]|uniref:hypothetical protein n=1 Tax=Niallia taxi TaxID=2499688 RepID=UPI003D26D6D8